jgi:pimeloyl-ACP methyl ester carboxylesterase
VTQATSTFGDPRKPPILFLHGIRLGREIWSAHAERLASRYYVVTVDLPGHGSAADLPFTEENVRAALTDAIERVAGRPPLFVGYSLGGFVAMRHAARFPEQTAGLLLADCTLDFEGWRSWPYRAGVQLTAMLPDEWFDALIHFGFVMTLPQKWREIVEPIPFSRAVFAQTSAIVASSRYALEEVASYRKPVLIVNGEYDFVFRLDERRFLHRLPQARLRIIRRADHTGPLRRSGEFTSLVEEFARKVFGV